MITTILVPVDGSKLSERALALAIPLAEQHGARIVTILVHEPILPLVSGGGAPVRDAALDERHRAEQETSVLKLAQRTRKLTSAPVEAKFAYGRIVPTLVEQAKSLNAELIVASTHGRGGIQRFWLGSVADGLVRHALVPVLLVRGNRPTAKRVAGAPAFTRALVPLDGSARAEEAADAAVTLLRGVAAKLTLLHVVHPMTAVAAAASELPDGPEQEVVTNYLEPVARRFASAQLEVRLDVRVDANVARVVLEAAEAHDAELIAIAGQGMSGVQRFIVGSVADKLIRTSPVPVLVVPPRG
ncbi:MAG: universal stress protein [Gemmatimonadaceae bacterium]|nr:universal stress protein [Gemmatimonadaceae bacterium]